MKKLLVLGAGTAGTMAVNKLRPRLPRDERRAGVERAYRASRFRRVTSAPRAFRRLSTFP